MNTNLDYFSRGLAKAFERRAQEQTVQHTRKIGSVATKSNVDTTPKSPPSFAKQFDEEKYRTTIITKMIALITKHKSIIAQHNQQ